MTESRIIPVLYAHRGKFRTRPVYQYDYGQSLRLQGFPSLPSAFEVHFAISGSTEATTQIGMDGIVPIPNSLLTQTTNVVAWLFLHETGYDGETRYEIEIPIRQRAAADTEQPDPEQESVITQAILALNEAIDRSGEFALKAEGFAQGTQDGTPVEEGSPYHRDNAEYWCDRAEQAANAAGYMTVWIDEETGDLMYARTDAVSMDLALDDSGDLILSLITD